MFEIRPYSLPLLRGLPLQRFQPISLRYYLRGCQTLPAGILLLLRLRELQNRLSQAMLLAKSLRLEPEDLGLLGAPLTSHPDRLSLEAYRAKADQEAISTSLSLTHQNISAAARLLKISRVSLYRLLEKHQLQHLSNHSSHQNPDRGNGEGS